MSSGRRKRRAVILLALALACGGLAASRVQTREHEVEAAVGPLVPVVVTRADVAPGDRLKPQQLAVRQVPERFAPRDALAVPDDVAGQRAAGAIAAGGYVTAGSLQSAAAQPDGQPAPGTPVRRGERSVDLAVAGGAALADAPPGTRVDVIVTSEPRGGSGGGRTYLALQDVELLAARAADDGGAGPAAAGSASDGAAAHATTVATLRVTLKQAVFLTAAQSFAREIRLLERAPGDRRAAPPLAVSAGGL